MNGWLEDNKHIICLTMQMDDDSLIACCAREKHKREDPTTFGIFAMEIYWKIPRSSLAENKEKKQGALKRNERRFCLALLLQGTNK